MICKRLYSEAFSFNSHLIKWLAAKFLKRLMDFEECYKLNRTDSGLQSCERFLKDTHTHTASQVG
jgi:hypothetical protein